MPEAVQQFVERVGLLLESEGLPRSAGRIFGLLLVSETPFSLDELTEQLQVSKASVSTNARFLEQVGLLERISTPGDRRDYYQIGDDALERMLGMARRRWVAFRALVMEGVETLPEEMEIGRERLRAAGCFQTLLLEHADELIKEWRERCCAGTHAALREN